MIKLIFWFIFCIIVLWLLVMYKLWKDQRQNEGLPQNLSPFVSNFFRILRKSLFTLRRKISLLKSKVSIYLAKVFFFIFPKAKKAFEKRDSLTGLEQGPSSYFLMSISKEVAENKLAKKTRRKIKNV